MRPKIVWFILIISCLAVFAYALQRDMRFEKSYTGDLRNRVVGARLIKDGQSPYFYKWKKGDPLRYYDPTNFDTLKAAVITSSPFLHQLLSPIVELPQAQISRLWIYYTVQWIFPLLLAAAIYQPERKIPYFLLLTGLLLNCFHFTFIKMGNTIGEYLILASLLAISTLPGPKPHQKAAVANIS